MAKISKEDLKKEITALLEDADLKTITSKKIRQQLEEKLDCDLTSRKKEVDELVLQSLNSKKKGGSKKNGKEDDDDEDDEGGDDKEEEEEEEEEEEDDEEDEKPKRAAKKPTPQKRKRKSSEESGSDADDKDDSEEEEEYSPAKKAKGGKAKGKAGGKRKKKGSDSDSDDDWGKGKKKSGGAKKAGGAKRGGGGYTKVCKLTPELAAVVGQDSMARHEVIKKMWAIIKEKNLYDPKNKQFAICNDELLKVFGVKRFRCFGMMKLLKNHFVAD
ncbi:upstream activation factor subunit spp27 [Nilaparvata lugens]|uniref:upstream activation factor subunit spp27 n=1 Tax=Nilaparvata lugens TaxID=108931 RepID=UPI00193E9A7A|nr:upstream activation factor subunit spp27 [Nilaparvata lugens]